MPINWEHYTWAEMATAVENIHGEMKRRNPIGINWYAGAVSTAATLLREIAEAEADHFTSEAGPKEPKPKKKGKK